MSRTREFSFVAGVVVFVALLFGAAPATAEPPAGPATEVAQPVESTTANPRPAPGFDPKFDDFAAERPTTDPTTTTEPTPSSEPTPEPSTEPVPPVEPKKLPPRKVATPNDPPPAEPTTGSVPIELNTTTAAATPTQAGPQTPEWLFWLVPAMAVLTLAAGLSGWWLARSEQRDRP